MPIQLKAGDIDTILPLLREVATREELNGFLRDKKMPFSAPNLDIFIEKRLRGAYDEKLLTAEDLVSLLRTTEEYGGQHVLLYRCPQGAATRYLERAHVHKFLRSQGAEDLPEHPRVLDRPKSRQMVDVRWDIEGSLGRCPRRR